ncbi:ATP-dependent DNA helicase PIF1, partial [Trifolium pratense]
MDALISDQYDALLEKERVVTGEVKTYLSSDTPCEQSETLDGADNILTPEFLNTIRASGLPNHELKLK